MRVPQQKGLDMPDNIEYMQKIHEVDEQAAEAIEFVDKLANSDIPDDVAVEFVKVSNALKLQQYLIRKLVEHHLMLEDNLNRIAEKHLKD